MKQKFIDSMPRPKRVVIAGLPEKYGLSMDFFLLGQMLGAETVAIDDRSDILQKAQEVYRVLKSQDIFHNTRVVFREVGSLTEFDDHRPRGKQFDLTISSEVLQRLDGEQATYVSNLKRLAKNFAIFVPNRGNKSHAKLSGLKSLHLRKLLKYCHGGSSALTISDYGYIDMPPFPPGLSRSREKRKRAAEGRLETFLMAGLEIYSLCEDLIPELVQERVAYIVYIMAKSQYSLCSPESINAGFRNLVLFPIL